MSNTHLFKTGADLQRLHHVEREISMSWPPPQWFFDAVGRCPADAYVHWNTRGKWLAPGTGIAESIPITLVVSGGGEVTVRYYEPDARDIWQTDPQTLTIETGSPCQWSRLQRPKPIT